MISILLEKVMQGDLNFEQLEKLLWKSTLELFQHVMVEVLEKLDQKLMENRDKSRFVNVNSRIELAFFLTVFWAVLTRGKRAILTLF